MNNISFIHISDVHLGIEPDKGYSWSRRRSEEIYKTFERIIDEANEKRVDFLFITGNLFDSQPSLKELDYVNSQFNRLVTACVVYIAGVVDYIKPDSLLAGYGFCPWVYVLGIPGDNKLSEDDIRYAYRSSKATVAYDHLIFPHKNTDIYGSSCFGNRVIPGELYEGYLDYEGNRQIFLMCKDRKNQTPVSLSDVKKTKVSYIGLGGQPKYEARLMGKAYFPGSPEAYLSSDTGAHGYIYGSYEGELLSVQFVPFCIRRYKEINYPVTNYTGVVDVAKDLTHILEHEGLENMYTINIVRNDGCEKNFPIADMLKDYRIINLNGDIYERCEYDQYVRANRNNEFGILLDRLSEADIEKHESLKLIVDNIIELSGLYMKHNKKLGREAFLKAKKETVTLLELSVHGYEDDGEIKKYRKDMEIYEVSPDVLEELNRVWAKERKVELEIKTLKNRLEEESRAYIRVQKQKKARFAGNIILAFGILMLIISPTINKIVASGTGGTRMLAVLSCTVIAFAFLLWLGSYFEKRRMKLIGFVGDDESQSRIRLELDKLEKEREKLHKVRIGLQKQDGLKCALKNIIDDKEKQLSDKLYKIQVMKKALELLS